MATGFNPRPRVGGDGMGFPSRVGDNKFQSTPPRGGRRGLTGNQAGVIGVSIHAPAWGATYPT